MSDSVCSNSLHSIAEIRSRFDIKEISRSILKSVDVDIAFDVKYIDDRVSENNGTMNKKWRVMMMY